MLEHYRIFAFKIRKDLQTAENYTAVKWHLEHLGGYYQV